MKVKPKDKANRNIIMTTLEKFEVEACVLVALPMDKLWKSSNRVIILDRREKTTF